MNLLQSKVGKRYITGLVFFLLLNTVHAQNGEQLFKQNCASCHAITKDLTGPKLGGVTERGPWGERKNLYDWIHNPSAFMTKDPYTQNLKQQYGTVMTAFPQLSEKDIDAIIDYVMTPQEPTGSGGTSPDAIGEGGEDKSNRNAIIFGVISLILAIIALILMQVNSNLKKLSDDKENIHRPEPVPIYRNKVYIALLAVLLFVVGGYYVGKGAIGLGRQQGYSPKQPIYYSHKVHVGINQINCLYCHGGAWDSKHALIPSVNVCMNCHKSISTYEKGPQLFDEEGNKIDGTAEINKLYKYAGFTPGPGATWDPAKAKQIDWVKIHNLPDHVYFNHAQHVKVGNVQCQTCHGNIQDMHVVKQESELSMGWCVNCHRDTKVNFNYSDSTGNKFYSIYEKFHRDLNIGELDKIRKDTSLTAEERNKRINALNQSRKMDSVTVMDIGGLECQKCHY